MPSCVRCGDMHYGYDDPPSPWCEDCRSKHPAEYADWVPGHPRACLSAMGVPPTYRSCSLEMFEADSSAQRQALSAVKRWAKDAETGLYLCGPVGVGKTHLAVAALLELCARQRFGIFVSARELLFQCREAISRREGLEEILRQYSKKSVLLLDDVGAENSTEFARETLLTLVDRGYQDRQQFLVTSNLDLEGLSERLDARIVDRLLERCQPVKIGGTSYRQKIAQERNAARKPKLATEVSVQRQDSAVDTSVQSEKG